MSFFDNQRTIPNSIYYFPQSIQFLQRLKREKEKFSPDSLPVEQMINLCIVMYKLTKGGECVATYTPQEVIMHGLGFLVLSAEDLFGKGKEEIEKVIEKDIRERYK